MKTFEQLIEEHGQWADATFPKGTAKGALIHAGREINEVIDEIDALKDSPSLHNSLSLHTEYADVLFCVMDSARRKGISVAEILRAGNHKLQINKARQWKDNGDGSYSHIK